MSIFKKLILVVVVLAVAGCGYKMVGKETHLPAGITSIAIPTFKNKTYEPGLEILFTQTFLTEMIEDRRINVVDRADADSILEGVITSYQAYSISYDRSGLALEYRVTTVADVTLRRRSGEVIWTERGLTETRTFRTDPSPVVTESNKNATVAQIGRLMAERIRNRFYYNF